MPATSPIPSSTTPRRSNHHESETQQQHHSHNHQRSPHAVAVPPASSAFALRKQWEAKLVSLQRGMEHVQHCRAGDACGSSLCHSTRRLMHTYENHQCPPVVPAINNSATTVASATVECKVCKLWDFLMTRRTQMAAIAQLRRPLTHHLSRDAPSSCRVAAVAGAIPGARRSAASVYSRVLASQKEAVHLSARRRF